ncbi:9791_t:CDS:2, partial [Entrophospora sp. SA101]
MEELRNIILRPRIAKAINQSNYETIEDILQENMLDLSVKLNLKIRDINELITCILEYMNETASTKKLSYPLKTGKEQYRILTTGDQIIDKIIGGGIYNKGITEIVGESSVGKTQLCLQLCLTVQLPIEFGGFAGGAVYVLLNVKNRSKEIYKLGIKLKEISHKYQLPIICVNQVSDLFTKEEINSTIIDKSYSYCNINYSGNSNYESNCDNNHNNSKSEINYNNNNNYNDYNNCNNYTYNDYNNNTFNDYNYNNYNNDTYNDYNNNTCNDYNNNTYNNNIHNNNYNIGA